MAKTTLLLLLIISSILVVADQAAATATESSPVVAAAEKSIVGAIEKATDAVISVAPPAKQAETLQAISKHLKSITTALDKAKESGYDKKIVDLAFRVEIAASVITAAPPEKRLKMMENTFNSLATPNPLDCPTVDKAYCETNDKIQKASEGVIAVAPAEKRLEIKVALLKNTVSTAASTIDKAYADGDEEKIAQVLAAYSKAADEVIVAAPADKLNVMEKTFATAGKN